MSINPICLIVQPIHLAGHNALKAVGLTPRVASKHDMKTVAREIVDATAVITRSAGLSSAVMDNAPQLRVIGSHGVGFDEIAVDHATRLGIPIVNTPDANRHSVAEHTVALILSVAKRIISADVATRRVDFNFKYQQPPSEVSGKTLAVIGFGGIGRRVAAIMKMAFKMDVLVVSETANPAEIEALGYRAARDLNTALAAADIITLHRALRQTSRRLIGAEQLLRMRPGAILINTARGALIDENALAAGLARGHPAGAGLDVFESETMRPDHPLLHLPNVVLTPHIAGSSNEALERTALQLVERISAVLSGTAIDVVNSEVWPRRRR